MQTEDGLSARNVRQANMRYSRGFSAARATVSWKLIISFAFSVYVPSPYLDALVSGLPQSFSDWLMLNVFVFILSQIFHWVTISWPRKDGLFWMKLTCEVSSGHLQYELYFCLFFFYFQFDFFALVYLSLTLGLKL